MALAKVASHVEPHPREKLIATIRRHMKLWDKIATKLEVKKSSGVQKCLNTAHLAPT
jgi:hypothetical protein